MAGNTIPQETVISQEIAGPSGFGAVISPPAPVSADVSLVLLSIHARLTNNAAVAQALGLQVLDGAVVIFQRVMAIPAVAQANDSFDADDMNIIIGAGRTLTVQFTAAPPAGLFQDLAIKFSAV